MKGFARLNGALVLSAGALLASISVAQGGDVEFWSPFTGPDGTAIEALVQEFNSTAGAEAGVNIQLLIVPWDQYYTKLSVSLASRQAPDLAIMHSHQIAGFVGQGALEAYTPEEISTAGLVEAEYVPALWQAGDVEGQRYGIPIDAFPRHIYYNKALFEQAGLDPNTPPTTGEELLAAARAIEGLGNADGLWMQVSGAGVARNFYSLYWQHQEDLYNADLTDVAEGFQDSARSALQALDSLHDDSVALTEDITDSAARFAQNQIGITMLQITDLPVYQAAAADQGLQFGVGPFPQFGPEKATFALGHNFIIPRGTSAEARTDAMVFIKWVGDNSLAWAKTGKVPAKLTTIESADFQALPEQSLVAQSMEYVQFPPVSSVQPAVDRAIQETIEAFYAGQMDVEQTVTMLADRIRAELAKQ